MTVLSAFTIEDLQAEIDRRQCRDLGKKINTIYDAIQDAENFATSVGCDFDLHLGENVHITFNVREETWYTVF